MSNRSDALKTMGANMYALVLDELTINDNLSKAFQQTWLEAFNKGIENIDKIFAKEQFRELEKQQRMRGLE